jgi:uncharacterized cupin superfamily protein
MRALGLVVVMGLLGLVVGVRVARSQSEHQAVTPADMKWGEAPPVFKKGAKMAVLVGDPKSNGMFIVRLKMPTGYKIMPHWHPTDENITVISGGFAMGMGDTLDPSAKVLLPGAFMSMPAKAHHFGFAKGETVVEVAGMGPFAMTYVNPADDPSKQQATTK